MLAIFPFIPILTAILLYLLPFEKIARAIAICAQTALTGVATWLFLLCKNGDVISNIGNFEGVLGIILRVDTLSSVFLILTSFIFLIITIYSFNDSVSRIYWFFLFAWQGIIHGVFLSGDIFNIFVLLEAIAIVISVLIMYNRIDRAMYDGMFYLMTNTVAMQFFLFGAGYIYKLTGALDMETASKMVQTLDKSQLMLPFALIMTAVCLKCALVPLFGWLPKAHGTPSAPSAVSAILSGLHIKTGVYLFIRFQGIFQEITVTEFFLVIGIITGIIGFLLALSQTDVKLILAYHTISQVGTIITGLSLNDAYSYTGGIYHIINHALFKSTLFLCAGVITQYYGTRDVYEIKGVLRRTPIIGAATIMAILGITGAPFFNGSISKYFIMSGAGRVVSYALIFINLGTIISFIKYATMLFGRCDPAINPVKISKFKQVAVLIPAVLCFAGGIFGEQFIKFLFNIDVSVDAAGYLEKILIFVISGLAGFFIYKYFVKTSPLLKKLRKIDLSFRATCMSIGAFFAVILAVMWFVN